MYSQFRKQQGAWMNGVQNWGYSSLMINSRTCPGLITSTLFAAKLAERLERLDGRFIY